MRRREFLVTLAAGAAVVGFAGISAGTAGVAGNPPRESEPESLELPIRGDPHTLSSGFAMEGFAGGGAFGADPFVSYGLPGDWRDRYVLGIEA